MMSRFSEKLFSWVESPMAVDRVIRGLAIACAVLFLIDVVYPRYTYVPGEGFWGFYGIVGFAAFTLLVLGAKQLRKLIRRPENYYAPNSVDSETSRGDAP